MICCEFELLEISNAETNLIQKRQDLVDSKIALSAQQKYTRDIEELAIDGMQLLNDAVSAATSWVNDSKTKLLIAVGIHSGTLTALVAAENAYNSSAGSSQMARAILYELLLAAETAASAAAVAVGVATQVLVLAEAAAARALAALAQAIKWGGYASFFLLTSWIESKALEELYAQYVDDAQMAVYSAENRLLIAESDLEECLNNAGTCSLCDKCVNKDELEKCQGCGGLYCDGCFSSYIEERELEMLSIPGI